MATQRNNGIDLLKVGLAISVVLLHITFFSFLNEYWFYVVKDGLIRIGVPTFFVISGYYFKYDTWDELRIWCVRLARIYVIWMFFYYPFWFDLDDPFSLENIKFLFLGYFHLWYLTGLLFAGIMLFLLRHQSTKLIIALILPLILIGFFIQTYAIDSIVFGYENPLCCPETPYLSRNALFVGLPFVALGFLIRRYQVIITYYEKWCGIFLLLGFILLFAEANLYAQIGMHHGIDILLSLIFVAPALFIWAKRHTNGKTLWHSIDPNFALAVYLVHPFLAILVRGFELQTKVISDLIIITCTFIISMFLVKLHKRLPLF